MAKKVKFPLKMADESQVRTLDELREHFDLASVLSYYANGRLVEWLNDRYYEDEAANVNTLDSSAGDFKIKLCEIFGVAYSEEKVGDVDLAVISDRNERRERLKKYTANDKILAAVDRVAFSQEDLADLLDDNIMEIYLCGERFKIPESKGGVTYIGVDNPKVTVPASYTEKGIKFKNVIFDTDDIIRRAKETTNQIEAANLWYIAAAEHGNAEAQYRLGGCFEAGTGVEKDLEEAVKWLNKAVNQGYDNAKIALSNLLDTIQTKGIVRSDSFVAEYEGDFYYCLDGVIYKENKDGSLKAKILESEIGYDSLVINNGWLYAGDYPKILRVSLRDISVPHKEIDSESECFTVNGDFIYTTDGTCITKINILTDERIDVYKEDGIISDLTIVGEYLFFICNSKIYKLALKDEINPVPVLLSGEHCVESMYISSDAIYFCIHGGWHNFINKKGEVMHGVKFVLMSSDSDGKNVMRIKELSGEFTESNVEELWIHDGYLYFRNGYIQDGGEVYRESINNDIGVFLIETNDRNYIDICIVGNSLFVKKSPSFMEKLDGRPDTITRYDMNGAMLQKIY